MRRLLLVDDQDFDREAIVRALRHTSYKDWEVLEAWNEATCMAHFRDDRMPDCILLDYSMPGRDGLKLMQLMLDENPFAAIIMITGQGNETVAVQALKSGAMDYLVKDSIDPMRLETAIRHALDHSRMAQRIEDQQQSLAAFSNILVHDLRAPLLSIRQAISMLKEDLPDTVIDEHGEMIDFVHLGAQKMDELIQTLRLYNEVDGDLPKSVAVPLLDVFNTVKANLSADLMQANANLIYSETLPVVQANLPEMVQLFQNIVGNGIKYNKSAAPSVQISTSDDANNWQVEVSDNGIGIEERYCERIFEPFSRLHVADAFEGTGLGLATSKKIVQRLGGKLWCRPGAQKGTTFVLTLPKSA